MISQKPLKAVWTAINDLQSQYNFAAESELTAILAAEINAEIDSEILKDLRIVQLQEEAKYQFKIDKKKHFARSIDEDWEVSNVD